jgi:hypothetical protein
MKHRFPSVVVTLPAILSFFVSAVDAQQLTVTLEPVCPVRP